jgi:hypothetical protein
MPRVVVPCSQLHSGFPAYAFRLQRTGLSVVCLIRRLVQPRYRYSGIKSLTLQQHQSGHTLEIYLFCAVFKEERQLNPIRLLRSIYSWRQP